VKTDNTHDERSEKGKDILIIGEMHGLGGKVWDVFAVPTVQLERPTPSTFL
jgi:hypothetical protein